MIRTKKTTVFSLDNEQRIKQQYVSLFQEFDKKGLIIREIRYKPAGEISSKTLFTYNKKGQLIEQANFEKEDRLVERRDFLFDEKGNLFQTEISGFDGCKKIKEYHFDPVENIEKAVFNTEFGEIEGYEISWYSQRDEVIAEVKSDANNRTKFKRFASYDGAGRLVMEEIFGHDEKFERKRTYFYLPNGKLEKVLTHDKKGVKTYEDLFGYNDQHLLVKRITENKICGTLTQYHFSYETNGKVSLEEITENDRLVFKHSYQYDPCQNLIEEEMVGFAPVEIHVIKKHELSYW